MRLLDMVRENGSERIKNSPCITEPSLQIRKNISKSFYYVLLGPTLTIYLSTVLLHRNRAMALTSGTLLKNILIKYIPATTLYGGYKFIQCIQIDITPYRSHFNEIEEEFARLYAEEGRNYFSSLITEEMIARK
jgi:hypothetical protein